MVTLVLSIILVLVISAKGITAADGAASKREKIHPTIFFRSMVQAPEEADLEHHLRLLRHGDGRKSYNFCCSPCMGFVKCWGRNEQEGIEG